MFRKMFILSLFYRKKILKIKINIHSHPWVIYTSMFYYQCYYYYCWFPRLQTYICHSLVTHSMVHVYLYRVILLVSTYSIKSTFSFFFWLPGLQIIPQINKALLKCLAQVHVYEPTFYYEVWLCLSYWAWTRDMDEEFGGDNGYKTNHWFLL